MNFADFTYVKWLKCHDCGWEHDLRDGLPVMVCPECRKDNIHIHSSKDGELPKFLQRPAVHA